MLTGETKTWIVEVESGVVPTNPATFKTVKDQISGNISGASHLGGLLSGIPESGWTFVGLEPGKSYYLISYVAYKLINFNIEHRSYEGPALPERVDGYVYMELKITK